MLCEWHFIATLHFTQKAQLNVGCWRSNNWLQHRGSHHQISIKLAEQGWWTRGHNRPQDKITGYAARIRPTTNKSSVWFNGDLCLVKQQLKNNITSAKNTSFFPQIDNRLPFLLTHECNWLKRYLPSVSVSTAVSVGIPRHIVARTCKLKK